MSVLKKHPAIKYTSIPNQAIEDLRMSPIEFRVYCYLYSKPNNWEINNEDVKKRLGIKTSGTLGKYWRNLIKLNLIKREESKRLNGKFTGYDYEILPYSNEQHTVQTVTDKNLNGSISTLSNTELLSNTDKKNNTIKNVENKFPIGVITTYRKILFCFPEKLRPKNENQKKSWLDTIDKLKRLDGVPFSQIIEVTTWTRQNKFWSKNFLSLVKMRKKNPDGIPYHIVWSEAIASEIKQPKLELATNR